MKETCVMKSFVLEYCSPATILSLAGHQIVWTSNSLQSATIQGLKNAAQNMDILRWYNQDKFYSFYIR